MAIARKIAGLTGRFRPSPRILTPHAINIPGLKTAANEIEYMEKAYRGAKLMRALKMRLGGKS